MKWLLARGQRAVLAELVASRPLLAFDFDGVLAPLAARPEAARIPPALRGELRRLCERFPCAVISGRSLASLGPRLRGLRLAAVVGNHGSEWQPADPREARWAGTVRRWHEQLAGLATLPGVELENKRLSLSLHYRDARDRQAALRTILAACGELAGARVVRGICVVNVVPAGALDKGQALRLACRRLHRERALFLGDDVTDEDAFALVGGWPGLVAARVGRSRASQAPHFLRDQAEVAELLALLARAL